VYFQIVDDTLIYWTVALKKITLSSGYSGGNLEGSWLSLSAFLCFYLHALALFYLELVAVYSSGSHRIPLVCF